MSAKSFWPDFDDDWSVEMLAQVMLDMPKRVNLVLHLPWDTPVGPMFERRTAVMLRRIARGTDVPWRKQMRTLGQAQRDSKDAFDQLDGMLALLPMINERFDTMAFTRAEIETMPDGYRREVIAQRRRKRLHVVE